MNKGNSIVLILIFLFAACKSNNDNQIIYSKFQDFGGIDKNWKEKPQSTTFSKNFITFFEYNKSNDLIKLKSTLEGRQYGHFFEFDSLGDLINYYYLIGDSLHNSFELKKDLFSNSYTEKGNPFVDYMPNNTDSTYKKYSLLFSNFPRNNLKVLISTNGHEYLCADLHNSKIMPLLKETDIIVNNNVDIIFFKIEANHFYFKLNGLTDFRVFYDTLRI